VTTGLHESEGQPVPSEPPGGTPATATPEGGEPPRPTGFFGSMRAVLGPWVELVVVVALAFGAAYCIQWLIVKPYRIPSQSMEHTLDIGDRVLVARFWYRFNDVGRGDIVVFHPPLDERRRATTPDPQTFIKRAIGLPGDWVGTTGGQVYICSSKPQSPATPLATPGCRILDEPYTQGVTRSCSDRQNFGPLYVPAGHYLLLGDNREDSQDGRCFGLIPKSWILGRAFARIWPLQRVGLL
jgi:signal peptidase I